MSGLQFTLIVACAACAIGQAFVAALFFGALLLFDLCMQWMKNA